MWQYKIFGPTWFILTNIFIDKNLQIFKKDKIDYNKLKSALGNPRRCQDC